MEDHPRRILRLATVRERTGLSRSVIYVGVKAGTFPRPVPLSDKSVGWLESEVEAWIATRVALRDARLEADARAAGQPAA